MPGGGATILHYDGTTWHSLPSGTTQDLLAVWGRSASDVFVVGYGGIILHYNGSSWTPQPSGTARPLSSVWGTRSGVFAVGDGGTILFYNGTGWVARSFTTTGRHGLRSSRRRRSARSS